MGAPKFSLSAMAQELVDAGDLEPKCEGFFEDMGGHLIHEDSVPSYFEYYLERLSAEERAEVVARMASEESA